MRRLHCVQTWAGRSQRQVGDQDAMRATPACKTPNLLSELPEIADLHARVCPQLLAVVLLMLSCFCLKQSSQACITLAEAFGTEHGTCFHSAAGQVAPTWARRCPGSSNSGVRAPCTSVSFGARNTKHRVGCVVNGANRGGVCPCTCSTFTLNIELE